MLRKLFEVICLAVIGAVATLIIVRIVKTKGKDMPNPCAAEKLTGQQEAYVKYKKALSRWSYDNGVVIDYDAIDSLYYFPNK